MGIRFQLNGEWDPPMTSFFMKAMFCREMQFLYVSPESMSFLKDWASWGAPFALTDYNRIFDDYFTEFSANPSGFLRSFFNELKTLYWPEGEYRTLLLMLFDIENPPLKCSFQVVYLKLVKLISVRRGVYIDDFEPIERMPNLSFDINYYILNELYEPIDDLLDLVNDRKHPDNQQNFERKTQDDLLILIETNVSSAVTSINIKSDSIRTFQELLDLLFNSVLINKVPKHSYGRNWTIAKYTGADNINIDKIGDRDYRTLSEVGIRRNDILILLKK
jgi:hypothetical protein